MIASERWETDPSLPEVPSHLLSGHSGKKVLADRWFFDEDIVRLEARALVQSSRARSPQPTSTRLQVAATQ